MTEDTRRRRHQVYMLIKNADTDHFFNRTWDVDKFIDEIEKIYGRETGDGSDDR